MDFFSPIRQMSCCCCMTTFFHIHSSLLYISSCQVTFEIVNGNIHLDFWVAFEFSMCIVHKVNIFTAYFKT